jgi:hypothetical protein
MRDHDTPASGGNGRAASARHDYRLTGGETVGAYDSVQGGAAHPLLRIAMILGRANAHCLAGGLRLGCRTTKRLVQGQVRLLNHVTAGGDEREHVLRVIVDEARGCLREVVEISSEELQNLKATLGELQGEARAVAAHEDYATPDSQYVRHWKGKD